MGADIVGEAGQETTGRKVYRQKAGGRGRGEGEGIVNVIPIFTRLFHPHMTHLGRILYASKGVMPSSFIRNFACCPPITIYCSVEL